MAFDAAAPAVQAPTPGANTSAKSAARGDASDPFGALLAMLDGHHSETPSAAPVRPVNPAEAAPAGKAVDAAPEPDAETAPVNEPQTPPAAVSDPATLMAAMMAPTAPTPVAVAAVPEPATALSPAAAVPQLGAETLQIAAETGGESLPTPQIALAAEGGGEPQTPAVKAEIPAPPAGLPVTTPQTAPTPLNLAANEKLVSPAQADQVQLDPTGVAVQGDGQDSQGQSLDGRSDGQPSDAEATQQARLDRPMNSSPDATAFTTAEAAPEAAPAPAPTAGPAQSAAQAPVIAAQAAVLPVRGAPETVAHLAAQMIQRLDGQTTRFDLTLNPQSLGRVDVRIEIGANGALRAKMAFDDAATAQEMGGRHTELRAALQSAGFDVPEGALSFDVASGGGGAFAERQDGDRAATPFFHNLADTADQDPAAVVKNYFSAAGSSGVDIRV